MSLSIALSRMLVSFAAFLAAFATAAWAESEQERDQARELFERLIGFDSSVVGAQTPAMASYLAGQFRAAGFAEDDVRVMTTAGTGNVSSLFVRYRGADRARPAILILGHLDVVPAHRADWERDPFALVEENGFFHARGAYDNKSSVALVASTLMRLRESGYRPRRDIVLWLAGDSETTEQSTRDLLSRDREFLGNVALALNSAYGHAQMNEDGVVSGYVLQNSEMSVATFTLQILSAGGHSSRPMAQNAIYDMSDALERVRQARVACTPTLISGGHAVNALPQRVELTMRCWFLPGVSPEDVLMQLRRLAGGGVSVELLEPAIVGAPSPPSVEINRALSAALSAIGQPNLEILYDTVRGATEGRYFRAAGIPTYGVGEAFIRPQDNLVHGLNERYPVESFYDGLTYWRVLITGLAR